MHLTGLTLPAGKGVPFVLGGGGYIRELHEKNEVVETGRRVSRRGRAARVVRTGETPGGLEN